MIEIAGRKIGPGEPTYCIAECGVAHNGRIDLALRLVDAAKAAGADAAKFQTWNTARLLSPASPQYRELLPLELSEGQFRAIKAHCDEVGITFLSTPDQPADADMLEAIGVPAFKLGSGALRNIPLLRHVAAKGKPIILSTGMGAGLDVAAAVEAIRDAGDPPLILLHCVSAYPARPEDYNLGVLGTLAGCFGEHVVGLSDHTLSIGVSLAAVALGASVIERHITLCRAMGGRDHAMSMEPGLFRVLVQEIRATEAAMGDGVMGPVAAEDAARAVVAEWRR